MTERLWSFAVALQSVLLIGVSMTAMPQTDRPVTLGPMHDWESTDNRGRGVGLDLQEIRQEDGHSTMEIGVYERSNNGLRCGDENFFVTHFIDPNGASNVVEYSDHTLVIHYKAHDGTTTSIDLNLTLDQNRDEWTGQFHRNLYDEHVVLKRVPKHPASLGPCVTG